MQDLLKVLPANAGSDLAGVREAQGVSQFSLHGLVADDGNVSSA
jgi:hypothetical protein